MDKQIVSTGYSPRPLQEVLHKNMKRFSVVVCHRRFGKTVFSINHMIHKGIRNRRKNPRYAYLAPLYGQAKRVAWDYLKMYTENIPGAVPNEADLRVDIERPKQGDSVRFTLLGADNPVSLKGIYLDGVILDEYAEMNPTAWREVIRPTLSDREGWAIFIGTPRGRNSFWELYERAKSGQDPDWFGALYKASETGILSPSELESNRREMTDDEFEQEYECSFQAALVGAYYGKEIEKAEKEGRITQVPYDESLPVNTYWDLGMDDSTTIWFVQRHGMSFRIIDYLEDSGLGLPAYARKLKEKGYTYGVAYLPHDAQVRELNTGKSRIETAKLLGLNPRIVPKHSLEDGIHATRMIFGKCWFDREKCKRGIEALQNYQRKWDAKNNIFSSAPLHNQWSHGADAFRMFALSADERSEKRIDLPRQADLDYSMFTHMGG